MHLTMRGSSSPYGGEIWFCAATEESMLGGEVRWRGEMGELRMYLWIVRGVCSGVLFGRLGFRFFDSDSLVISSEGLEWNIWY